MLSWLPSLSNESAFRTYKSIIIPPVLPSALINTSQALSSTHNTHQTDNVQTNTTEPTTTNEEMSARSQTRRSQASYARQFNRALARAKMLIDRLAALYGMPPAFAAPVVPLRRSPRLGRGGFKLTIRKDAKGDHRATVCVSSSDSFEVID
jgi:hypothetical protein